MKHLLFIFAFLPLLALAQGKKEVTLSETFGQCVSAGGRVPPKKSNCNFNDNTAFEAYAINDSIVYAVKIAVVSRDKPNTWKGFPEGSLFLEPNDKISYRYTEERIVSCDLDTNYFMVVLPWDTSLPRTLDEQKKYTNRQGCYSEIIQGTKASFEVAVRGKSRKK